MIPFQLECICTIMETSAGLKSNQFVLNIKVLASLGKQILALSNIYK